MKHLPLFISLLVSCSRLALADEATPIQGRVVDGEDKPVANARVYLWQLGNGATWTRTNLLPTATTTTDAEGNWKSPDPAISKDLLTVGVWSPGYTFGSARNSPLSAQDPPGRKIVIKPVTPVGVRLVDWKNHPVTGATARFRSVTRLDPATLGFTEAGWLWNNSVPEMPTTVAAAPDGSVTLPFAGKDDLLGVEFKAPGYQTISVTLNVPRDDGLVVRMFPAAALRGRLVDTAGKPMAGVNLGQLSSLGAGITAADGTFFLDGFDEIPLYLALLDDPHVLSPRLVKPVRATTTDVGDLVAQTGAVVSGHAKNPKTGQLITGWLGFRESRTVVADDWNWEFNSFTDPNGSYSVTVPAGKYTVSFTPATKNQRRTETRTIEVTDGKPLTLDFNVDPDARAERLDTPAIATPKAGPQPAPPDYIYGAVTGPDGRPVAGATVTVLQGGQSVRETKTGENGKFAVGPLLGEVTPGGGNAGGLVAGTLDKPAPKIYVRAEMPGMLPVSAMVALGSDAPVNLKFGLGKDLRLHLLDTDGKPVTGAKITLVRFVNYVYTADGPRPLPQPAKGTQLPAPATSDAAGNAVISALPEEGFCDVRLEHPDFATFTYTIALPRLQPVDLPLRKGAGVEGKIRFGEEVLQGANFDVKLQSSSLIELAQTAKPGLDGKFQIKSFPPTIQTPEHYVRLSVTPSSDKANLSPGLKLENINPSDNSVVYLTDTRDPNTTHRWLGYAIPISNLAEGQVLHQDIVLRPMTHVTGKVPPTKDYSDVTKLVVSYTDPNVDNSMIYVQPAVASPDKDGNFDMWVPAGKSLSLDVKPKNNVWNPPIMSVRLINPVADEDREVAFTASQDDRGSFFNPSRAVRLMGPDGATAPRIPASYKLVSGASRGVSTPTVSAVDGLVQIYSNRDLNGESIQIRSEYLDKPVVVTWDDKVPLPRIVLNRVPEQILKKPPYMTYAREEQGIPAPPRVEVGSPAPDFKVKGWLRGGPVSLTDLRGKTVVVTFSGPYGLLSLLPIMEKHPGKIVVVMLLSPEGGDMAQDYSQILESFTAQFGDAAKQLDPATAFIGQDTKVANDWRGATALSLGANYGNVIIDANGNLAAAGLWGAQFTAKVDQLTE